MTNGEKKVLRFLLKGGRHTAQAIRGALGGDYGLWESLIRMEQEGLVYRAYTYGDWTTFNHWKITGCGAIQWQARQND
jgi:hypothetical protein